MKLNNRGNFVKGFIYGVVIALAINFFLTHHSVTDTDTCYQSDEGVTCNWHYEENK